MIIVCIVALIVSAAVILETVIVWNSPWGSDSQRSLGILGSFISAGLLLLISIITFG